MSTKTYFKPKLPVVSKAFSMAQLVARLSKLSNYMQFWAKSITSTSSRVWTAPSLLWIHVNITQLSIGEEYKFQRKN